MPSNRELSKAEEQVKQTKPQLQPLWQDRKRSGTSDCWRTKEGTKGRWQWGRKFQRWTGSLTSKQPGVWRGFICSQLASVSLGNTDYVNLIDRARGGWGLHFLQEGPKRRISTGTTQDTSLCNTQTILYAWVEHLLACTADKHTICQQKWPPSHPAHLLRTKHAEELLCTWFYWL